ncbi:ABC transporter ATP-binding protein [Listeria ilorinensis]|uniref:ABC transporter ATP-binding protein n=1 Tax=Listeria ilorinensis TaxID=2867439 RepID=UPI001EF4C1A6|nr:ABC transporter ATP-binding protein [Listeria ilorinensis]
MTTILELKKVTKTYGERVILKNFDIEIKQQQFITIVGESGSGKSTLINILGLLEDFNEGELLVNGRGQLSKKEILRCKRYMFGYIFQDYALIPGDTVKQNLKISLKYRQDRSEQSLEDVMNKVGLDKSFLTKKVYTLSGGEQQRVAIARTILKPCQIILADEPTGNLDDDNSEKIIQLLKQLQNDGKTIICVTHDQRIADIADQSYEIIKLGRKTI